MDLNTFPCDRHKLYHFRKVQSHPHYFSENNKIFWRENSKKLQTLQTFLAQKLINLNTDKIHLR